MGKSIAKIKIKTDKIEDFIRAVEKACPLIRACEDLTDGDVTPVFWHKVV